jgi:hypothetical protein
MDDAEATDCVERRQDIDGHVDLPAETFNARKNDVLLSDLPDELILAVAGWLARPARYRLIQTCSRHFRVVLPLVYERRVKLSQRTIPSSLVDGKSPRLPFYLHAIRKAWLLFSVEDEEDVQTSGEDRILMFIDLYGHNLISMVVMERLPNNSVPWWVRVSGLIYF